MQNMRNLNAVLLLAAAGLAVGLWPLLGAQGQAENQRQAPIQFGDILLSNFRTAQVRLGTQAVVRGPDTQVDATDPKSGGKGRLLASQISAFMVPKSNLVERIEAEGNVRFSATRPAADRKGTLSLRGSGTKAVFYVQKRFLVLSGPVKFYAEQPTSDGKGKEIVDGKAAEASFDDEKRLLKLSGGVEATVITPDTPETGSFFSGDVVSIDMSSPSYVVDIDNSSGGGKVNIRLKPSPPPAKPGG